MAVFPGLTPTELNPQPLEQMLLKMLLILFSTAAPAGRALSDPGNYECPEWGSKAKVRMIQQIL
jgi:hypothetical protein